MVVDRPAAPRVSVLLPVRDAQATLGSALRSVQRQSEQRFECLVVDDGSRDASPDLVQAVAAHDPRFRLIPCPRRGLVAALCEGLRQCRGALVARMDADDLMHRERLSVQLAWLERDPSLCGVGCRVRLFPRPIPGDGMRAYEAWLNRIGSPEQVWAEAFVECPVAHPTLTIRREVLARFGYREMGWPEDYDLVLRLLAAGERLAVVPRRLLAWRDGPDRQSRRHPSYGQDRFTACKAAHLADGLLRHTRRYVLWGYGRTGRALRRALLDHGREPSHIVELHPGRLGNRIHGSPVIPPAALRDLRGRPVVASVAGAGPRGEIRSALLALGYREGRDFVLAA